MANATRFVELPAGCIALCGNNTLPGYPYNVDECNATVSVENCSSACMTLAEEVATQQTWLGVFVMCILAFWPMYSMGRHTGWGIKQVAVAVTVAVGWLNAAILGWRLFLHAVAAMSDGICLWPHPYEDGGTLLVRGGSRFFVWTAAAASPAMATIIKQGLSIPFAFWLSLYGRVGSDNERAYATVLGLASVSAIIMSICGFVGAIGAGLLGAGLLGCLIAVLVLRILANSVTIRLSHCHSVSCRKTENYPLWLDENWFKTDTCLYSFNTDYLNSSDFEKGLLGPFMYSMIPQIIAISFPPIISYALYVTTLPLFDDFPHNLLMLFGSKLSAAYAQFFAGFTIPSFVWLEIWALLPENFDTILGQLSLAIGIDLLLILETHLPHFGGREGTNVRI